MTDSSAPSQPDPAVPLTAPSEAPPEWKPEPRQWGWKDLFTAPMLAFKPKCMLVSAATAIVLLLWWSLLTAPLSERGSLADQLRLSSDSQAWYHLVLWIWTAASLAVAGIGASLVAVFLKADLLDDEFLSFREAIAQFRSRLLPAAAVPVFLLVLVTGFWLALWLGQLFCSIPYLGPVAYILAYPFAFAFALLAILVSIAAALGLFLFPGIVAVRSHGWFDNVVDTVEAVGTKPHLLVASIALTGILMAVAWGIGHGAIDGLNAIATRHLPVGNDSQLVQTESAAAAYRDGVVGWMLGERRGDDPFSRDVWRRDPTVGLGGWAKATGWAVAGWQLAIVALLAGYCINLALAGGLLTYLWVREDDYWDDEDLQDLDQLAKELEEEAKRDEAAERGRTGATEGGDQPTSTP